MSAQNQLTLLGNVGGENTIRQSTNDEGKVTVISFSFAVNEWRYNKATNQKERMTDFHNAQAFGYVAGRLAQFVEQGQGLLLQGRLYKDQYTNSEGEQRTAYGIEVEDFALVGGGGRGASQDAEESDASSGLEEDEFPF